MQLLLYDSVCHPQQSERSCPKCSNASPAQTTRTMRTDELGRRSALLELEHNPYLEGQGALSMQFTDWISGVITWHIKVIGILFKSGTMTTLDGNPPPNPTREN